MTQTIATTEAHAAADARPEKQEGISTGLCVGFAVGTTGTSVMMNTVSAYFPAFMATVLAQSPAVAGLMLTASKLYDIVADIVIGAASDRTRSRWGRRRPYLFAGAIVSALSLLMIFWTPFTEGNALLIYMGIALVVHATGYSLFAVPYMAMPPEIAPSYDARLKLMSFRTAFIAIGQAISLALTSWLINSGGGGMSGYRTMSIVMATIAFMAMMTCFLVTGRAPQGTPTRREHGANWQDFRALLGNRPLVMLMGAKLTQYLSFGIFVPCMLLFMLNVLQVGYIGQMNLTIAQNIAMFTATPIWLRIGRRIGKKRSYMLAVSLMAGECASWLITGAEVTLLGIWVRGLIFGFGSCGSMLMSSSMLPDAMEYDRLRTGLRREGVFSSIYAIVEKSGWAAGAAFTGLLLTATGYVATQSGLLVDQPENVITALYLCVGVIPAVLFTSGLLLIHGYKLDPEMLEQERAKARAAGLV